MMVVLLKPVSERWNRIFVASGQPSLSRRVGLLTHGSLHENATNAVLMGTVQVLVELRTNFNQHSTAPLTDVPCHEVPSGRELYSDKKLRERSFGGIWMGNIGGGERIKGAATPPHKREVRKTTFKNKIDTKKY
jgi:hypothetical protein